VKKFQNVSPIGALDIPALGRVVEAGEKFDVPDDLVEYFESQPANFVEVTASRSSRGGSKKQSADGDEQGGAPAEKGEEPDEEESTNDEGEADR
jgi:hypothetical protein